MKVDVGDIGDDGLIIINYLILGRCSRMAVNSNINPDLPTKKVLFF